MGSLIFPRAVRAAAAGATFTGLPPLLRGVLAHLVIQGAYLFEFAPLGMNIVCERRLWHLTDDVPTETIGKIIDSLNTGLQNKTAAPAATLDFALYVLELSSMPPTTDKPSFARKRFDIANLTTGQVFEIKPDSAKRIAEGRRYLRERIANYNAYLTDFGTPLKPLRPGRWQPPTALPAGLSSTLSCRLAEPGIIVYRFKDRDDDDTVQRLRADIRFQAFANEFLFYSGAAAAIIATVVATRGRAAAALGPAQAAAEVGEVVATTGAGAEVIPIARGLGRAAGGAATGGSIAAAASPADQRPAAAPEPRPRPFRLPWTDPGNSQPGPVQSVSNLDPDDQAALRPRPTAPLPLPAAETLPGGVGALPDEAQAAQVARLLTEELLSTFPDGLARDDDAPQLATVRRTALSAMLQTYLVAVGVVPGLTALAGDDIKIDPARVGDPVLLNGIALRISRSFAGRSLAIMDWLAFAPDDELSDMLATDAAETAE